MVLYENERMAGGKAGLISALMRMAKLNEKVLLPKQKLNVRKSSIKLKKIISMSRKY